MRVMMRLIWFQGWQKHCHRVRWVVQTLRGADCRHLDTCNVVITAAAAVTLSWAQIQTALDTLLNVCVRHPLLRARGGRAYHGQRPVQLSGRRRRDEGLTGSFPNLNTRNKLANCIGFRIGRITTRSEHHSPFLTTVREARTVRFKVTGDVLY